ncbi:MAG: BTAD domain-containing putative transcriptional regulator, partial [Aeromicrobium sp.]
MFSVEVKLLGNFAVRRDGDVVDSTAFGGRRVRMLVRILAAQHGRVASRDALIEALWGEKLPADPATNLNVIVNRARRALGQPDAIVTEGGGYRLSTEPDLVVDVEQFQEHVAEASAALARADHEAAAAAAAAALHLWDDPLPEDAYAEWARPHRDRLERLHQDALEVAAAAMLSTSRPREAVAMAADAVARQPLREASRILLIRAHAATGDQAAAVSAYLDLQRMLADELGIDPSAEATGLYEQLLHGTLRTPTPASSSPSPASGPPLVGRDRELEELLDASREGRVAVVSARSGGGKSRLLEAIDARSVRTTLAARCLLPEREEPWSLARSLLRSASAAAINIGQALDAATSAALTDVLPDMDVAAPPVDPQSRRALILRGAVRLLESTAPSLVMVDDLQWADSSSLQALAVLVGRPADVGLVLAYRPEEVDDESSVARFLADLTESGPLEVPLGPIDAESLQGLVASPSVASALAEHTDGSPFAVVQVARELEGEGLLRVNAAGGWDVIAEPASARVREVAHAGQRSAIWRQFERQRPEGRELAASLALLGRPAPLRLLTEVTGIPADEASKAVRDLARHHLVRHDTEGFRVDHDLVGETIRDRLPAVERARLHQQVANALENTDGPLDERARHLAGAGDKAAAAEAYSDAARSRLDLFANSEAQQLAEEGLALEPDGETQAHLLEVRGETRARQGHPGPAREDLRAALALTTSRPARSRLLTRLALLTLGAEDLLHAEELADLALTEAGDDPGARARALYIRGLVDMNLPGDEQAEERLDEALVLFTSAGDAAGMADILDARAMATFVGGDITAGIEEFDRVARLFTDSGDLLRVVTPRSTRGHGLVFAARPEEGLTQTSAALDLARNLGYAEGEAMVLWHHAETLVACGRPGEGLEAAQEGVALARRINHRGWTAATLSGLGLCHHALDDPDAATSAYQECLAISEHLVPFRSWACSRMALATLVRGDLEAVSRHVDEALAAGWGLTLYEARLAQCELAVRRGDDEAGTLVDQALELAVSGGHLSSAARLERLRAQVL